MKNQNIDSLKDYKYGFTTDIENIKAPKGLTEETIKFISKIKKEGKLELARRLHQTGDWMERIYERHLSELLSRNGKGKFF